MPRMISPEVRLVSEGWIRNWYADVKAEEYAHVKRLNERRHQDAERIAVFWSRAHDEVTVENAMRFLESRGLAQFLFDN